MTWRAGPLSGTIDQMGTVAASLTATGAPACAELTVVRHGESTANAAFAAAEAAGRAETGLTGRDAGVPLSPRGRAQAAGLGRWLAALPPARHPEVVLCSPYRRARQTWQVARVYAGAAGVTLPVPTIEPRLRDRVTGRLELLTSAAIAVRYPEQAARRRADGELRYRPPGGESLWDVAARLRTLLPDLDRWFAGRRVLVVAHDAVVLMLRHLIDGLGEPELLSAGPVPNGSLTRWRREGHRLVLAEANRVPPPTVGPVQGRHRRRHQL